MYNDNFNTNPDEFFGDYFNYFNNMQPVNRPDPFNSLYIALGIVIALGVVFSIFFLRKKNENKFKGFKRGLYNFLNLNKFYAEDIVRILNILSLLAISTTGIWMMFSGMVASGIALLILGNVGARIFFELTVMFIILCRKTVSMDKRLSKLEAFYSDDFEEDEPDACGFDCDECSDCGYEEPCSEGNIDLCVSCDGCKDAEIGEPHGSAEAPEPEAVKN